MIAEPRLNVTVRRRYAASPERVFDAWLDPATAGAWFFATPNGQTVRVEIDARVGGHFVVVDRRDGVDVEHAGEYLEIDRPRRLVFAFSVPTYSQEVDRVTVEIVPLGAGCELTLTHETDRRWAADAGKTAAGWATFLDGLAASIDQATETAEPAAPDHHR